MNSSFLLKERPIVETKLSADLALIAREAMKDLGTHPGIITPPPESDRSSQDPIVSEGKDGSPPAPSENRASLMVLPQTHTSPSCWVAPTSRTIRHPTPSSRSPAPSVLPHLTEEQNQSALRVPEVVWLRADEPAPAFPEDESALNPVFPARVTLCPPAGSGRTPFDSYKASAAEAPRPNPKRFVLKKLGLSEQEFNVRTAAEVDELLRECWTERRLEQLEASSSTAPRILTKDEAYFFFNATGIPVSSPALLGAYWWAADFGNTRFNFEMDLTPENIALLDAYD